ncbi:hypothetical protein [Jidongwangia harbinensis]|uniref:hypothetical protein n=1 Tax=Jidongwangia harbinensis TaxID=2878561 RepID=UPI001CD94C79|nr:hypothetical protein [Jidongwangia harbinensis]MCA2218190.1 hypothetical protein [Jidongwangia harbinensis]
MRRSRILLITALIGTAAAAPASLAVASDGRSPTAGTPDTAVGERYGIVRYDSSARRWAIVSGGVFRGSGLTGVSCAPGTGVLTVTFAPLTTIGTFTVDEDDAYAGRLHAGAALTTSTMAITFRATGGAAVPCHSAAVRIPHSSLQVWIRGGSAGAPATTLPTTSRPPTPPAPGTPTQTPPTTLPPTTPTVTPPTTAPPPPVEDPDESDPADG